MCNSKADLFIVVFVFKSYFRSSRDEFDFYHERPGDKFVTPCLKVLSGLLFVLGHPYLIRLFPVGYGLLQNNELKRVV